MHISQLEMQIKNKVIQQYFYLHFDEDILYKFYNKTLILSKLLSKHWLAWY